MLVYSIESSESPWTAADDERLLFALTGEPSKPFRLLDLPAELWVRIGKFAIDSSPTFVSTDPLSPLWPPSSDTTFIFLSDTPESPRLQPALTRTCRVLRQELLPYYYATKIDIMFDLDLELRFRDAIDVKWLRGIGSKNRKFIRGVRMELPKTEVEDVVAWLGHLGITTELEYEGVEEDKEPLTWYLGSREKFVYRARFLGGTDEA